MSDVVDLIGEIIDSLEGGARLELTLAIDEGGADASLDLVAKQTTSIVFCGWVSEAIGAYADYLRRRDAGDRSYPNDLVAQLDKEIIPWASNKSWPDCYEHRSEIGSLMRGLFAQASQQDRIAASPDRLRLELLKAEKVNPTNLQILISGAVLIMSITATTFGYNQIIKEQGAAACRSKYIDAIEKNAESLRKQAKLEGHYSGAIAQSNKDFDNALKAGIAACGSALEESTIELRLPRNIMIKYVIGPAKREAP